VNYQKTVLWLGLLLIALNLAKSWSVVKSTLFTRSSASTPGSSTGSFNSLGGINVPGGTLLPIPPFYFPGLSSAETTPPLTTAPAGSTVVV
jgi:hypothetical protein